MKKLLLLTMLVIGSISISNAQIKIGVKAGANLSSLNGDTNVDGRTSFYIGGLVDLAVSESFHVQPEVLYSSEGAEDFDLSILRVPIMAKYYIFGGLNLQAGPVIGIKVGADDAIDNQVKSFDYGLAGGAAFELEGGLFFDARYNIGLADISDVTGFEVKTNAFQVGLGYRF